MLVHVQELVPVDTTSVTVKRDKDFEDNSDLVHPQENSCSLSLSNFPAAQQRTKRVEK